MDLSQLTSKVDQDATSASSRCPQLFRHYAHIGYDRFDNVLYDHTSIGSANFGKATVDCKFLFEKSQWGVMSKAKNPAGIIYLDLSFHQPPSHRLKSATVTVRLDENHVDLLIARPRPHFPGVPIQIGTHGPTQINGEARRALKTSRRNIKPELDAGGFVGFGGVGSESETQYEQECRWIFSSQTRPDPKSHSSAYRILEWQLAENELETKSSHNNTIHTAFSFQHAGDPFLMHVSVKGKLQSRISDITHGMKSKAKKLKFGSDSSNSSHATTLINFGGRDKFRKPLDELAKGLAATMEQENMRSIPVEIPTSHRTTSRDVSGDEQSARSEGTTTLVDDATIQHQFRPINQHKGLENTRLGQITAGEDTRLLDRMPGDQGAIKDHPCLPTAQNLSDALLLLTDPRIVQLSESGPSHTRINPDSRRTRRSQYLGVPSSAHIPEQASSSKASSITLAVDEASTTDDTSIFKPANTKAHPYPAIISILQMTGLVKIVQMWMIFMSSWGLDISPPNPEMEGQAGHKNDL